MDKDIDLFRNEIKAVERFFAAPPSDIVSRYALDKNTPVSVRFGPDIESFIVKNGENIVPLDRNERWEDPVLSDILDTATHRLNPILYHDSESPPVELDGRSIEIKLAPASPADICNAYAKAQDTLQAIAAESGAEAFVLDGHWHISLSQNERDLFMSDKNNHVFNDLFRHAGAGILTWQENFPAFFIKPKTAELDHEEFDILSGQSPNYKGPARFSYHSSDGRASLRARNIESPQSTLEPRLSSNAPYQPVYLTLAAIRYGMLTKGLRLEESLPHPMAMFDMHRCRQDNDYDGAVSDDCPVTRRGKFGFLSMLKQTIENARRFAVIPEDMTALMLRNSIRNYKAYLKTPRAQMMYTADEMAGILFSIDEMGEQLLNDTPVKNVTNSAPKLQLI